MIRPPFMPEPPRGPFFAPPEPAPLPKGDRCLLLVCRYGPGGAFREGRVFTEHRGWLTVVHHLRHIR